MITIKPIGLPSPNPEKFSTGKPSLGEDRMSPLKLLIPFRVSPRGSKNQFLPYQADDEAVRVKITAVPESGKANTGLLLFLAEALGHPVSQIEILSGQGARHKRLVISLASFEDRDGFLEALAQKIGCTPSECFQLL
ncbi:MAG: DUF167 domain-containing protein [Cyanobacteria bacterium]|nr:DUF167 domain-containing protein [Cyanobacteriota bacterium]